MEGSGGLVTKEGLCFEKEEWQVSLPRGGVGREAGPGELGEVGALRGYVGVG